MASLRDALAPLGDESVRDVPKLVRDTRDLRTKAVPEGQCVNAFPAILDRLDQGNEVTIACRQNRDVVII
jgi:hypothetical protein